MMTSVSQMVNWHETGIYRLTCLFQFFSFLLLLPALFYFSLAFESYLQRKHADNFEEQCVEFKKKDLDQYVYKKEVYFTPEIATFLDSGGRIYVYIKDSVLKNKIFKIFIWKLFEKIMEKPKSINIAILIRKRALKGFNVQVSSVLFFRQ